MIKWIAAFIGYFLFRFPGAVLGFIVGTFLDNLGGSGSRPRSVFENVTRQSVSPADFELNLLSLCSIIIKADGQVNQRELDYVRQYFLSTYGKEKANAIFRTFNEVIKNREISTQRICNFMVQRTRYEVRLQMLHFLFGIAQSDGQVSKAEIQKLREIAGYFRVNQHDFESIMAMFIKSTDNSYKILEIEKTATDDEVKRLIEKWPKSTIPIVWSPKMRPSEMVPKKNSRKSKRPMSPFKRKEDFPKL